MPTRTRKSQLNEAKNERFPSLSISILVNFDLPDLRQDSGIYLKQLRPRAFDHVLLPLQRALFSRVNTLEFGLTRPYCWCFN